ncbi:hypothetical protein DOTSEDRAFT_75749 [Dothistroma septosporum NZE10]|uniref:DUF7707 domain-containing protein n=1 Tax=Dothistroma septosporum (strain NZE10 / CBS 128990) TaxID=675120 RepID=N1PC09_DOTSN|nr:hypothetical protein DOTSEDRAFT_75749 [Dothistroma septosporum NZE10]
MKSFVAIAIATGLFVSTGSASFGLPKRQQQYTINPDSVSNVTRDFWCQEQTTQCPLICSQTTPSQSLGTISNDCDSTSLTYACVCDNGLSPNVSEYSQTLPYYLCQEWGNECVSNCAGDTTCQGACRQDHPCGAQNPTRQNTSTLTSTMSKTTTGLGAGVTTDSSGATIYNGFGGQQASSTSGSKSAATHVRVWALSAGQTFGTLALAGAVFGGFAVLL